ncbi:MAG: hypothetical protein AAGC83_08920 [Pseudomonadota bacterium]
MTIGIAATGPNAGAAIIKALAAVERHARGAIGGFVSLVGFGTDGEIIQATTQTSGTAGLFNRSEIPDRFASAPIAGLMSSGPNRPEPLAQFTPAIEGVGLVTGHRLPNTRSPDGSRFNDKVLQRMANGFSAQAAIDAIIAEDPGADAGYIALSANGDLAMANAPRVEGRSDHGAALLRSPDGSNAVAVLHNAIHPRALIAVLASEIAMDAMQPPDSAIGWIRVTSGIPFVSAQQVQVVVDAQGAAKSILAPHSVFPGGSGSIGLGDRIEVVCEGKRLGYLGYEPFMTVTDNHLDKLDGVKELTIPVCA